MQANFLTSIHLGMGIVIQIWWFVICIGKYNLVYIFEGNYNWGTMYCSGDYNIGGSWRKIIIHWLENIVRTFWYYLLEFRGEIMISLQCHLFISNFLWFWVRSFFSQAWQLDLPTNLRLSSTVLFQIVWPSHVTPTFFFWPWILFFLGFSVFRNFWYFSKFQKSHFVAK
jgi:hypothetical protein